MSMFRIHQLIRREMFDRIVANSGLAVKQAADALEVITGEMEESEAIAWVYDEGARSVAAICRESFEDAHGPVGEVRLYETEDGQLFAIARGQAFTELEYSSSHFADDAAAILGGYDSGDGSVIITGWTLPFMPEAALPDALLADLETKRIAVYVDGDVTVSREAGVNGREYLGESVCGSAG